MTDQVSSKPESGNVALEITRTLNASCETVFDYFTQAENLSKWFAPDASMQTIVHKLDLQVGGEYEVEMANPAAGQSYILVGKYLEIERPSRLVYTWHWKSEPNAEVSKVTLDFAPEGDKTRLNICHDRFETQESCDKHGDGWGRCLDRLLDAV